MLASMASLAISKSSELLCRRFLLAFLLHEGVAERAIAGKGLIGALKLEARDSI